MISINLKSLIVNAILPFLVAVAVTHFPTEIITPIASRLVQKQ
jgi:hypothetical protein